MVASKAENCGGEDSAAQEGAKDTRLRGEELRLGGERGGAFVAPFPRLNDAGEREASFPILPFGTDAAFFADIWEGVWRPNSSSQVSRLGPEAGLQLPGDAGRGPLAER